MESDWIAVAVFAYLYCLAAFMVLQQQWKEVFPKATFPPLVLILAAVVWPLYSTIFLIMFAWDIAFPKHRSTD